MAFELANRAFFATAISDRGDAYFEHFAERHNVCGQGVATATVRDLCHLAATRHGVRIVRAATAHSNAASQRVLIKAGFVAVGPAEPADLGGKPGTWYQRDLTAESTPDE
jgi:[ribosomal protein S5]-alanine N-acetyltransferase